MNSGMKKRGWVYRGSLATTVTAVVILLGLCLISCLLAIQVGVPLWGTDHDMNLEVSNGVIGVRHSRGFYAYAVYAYGPSWGFAFTERSSHQELAGHFYFAHEMNPQIPAYTHPSVFHYEVFTLAHPTTGHPWSGYYARFPLWLIVCVLGIWPVWRMVSYWRARWDKTIRCIDCGYDLRGSKGSATCPECGEETSENQAGPAEP